MKKVTLSILLVLSGIVLAFNGQAQTVLLNENFQGVAVGTTAPAGWTITKDTPSYGWQFGSNSDVSSSYFTVPAHTKVACTNDDKHDDSTAVLNKADRDMIITPSIDLTGRTGCLLTFDAYYEGHSGYEVATVEVSTNGGTSWTTEYTLTGATSWQTAITVNLSNYVGNTIKVAFKYNDQNTWGYGLAIDNVVIKETPPLEVALTSLTMDAFTPVTLSPITTIPVKGVLTNYGANNINSATINWTVNGSPVQSETVTGLNIATGASATFTTTAGVSLPTPSAYNINVWVSAPNNGTDGDTTNNTKTTTVVGLTGFVTKNVMIEEPTGAWCQYCPDGALIMDTLKAHYTDLVPVSIHWGDATHPDGMVIADGTTVVNAYVTGFPSGFVDRVAYGGGIEQDRSTWENLLLTRAQDIVPVSVGIYSTYDSVTRIVTAKVYAKYSGPATGNFRINAYVCENDVTGTGNSYNQQNAYSGNSNYPVLGALPHTIVGWHHQQVLRSMMGGPWGTDGVIPNVVAAGDTFVQTYTYTVPASYHPENMFVVGLVQAYSNQTDQRPIINSVKSNFNVYNQTNVATTYYTTDTATATSGNPLVFHTGDTLYTDSGPIIFQVGDTVTINGTTFVITNFGDSVVINVGDEVVVDGPNGSGTIILTEGQHYYQTSNGTVTLYTPNGIDNSVDASENFTAYPNPTNNVLHLNMLLAKQGSLQVSMINIAGQKVYGFESANYNGGASTLSISTADLPTGVYILSVTTAQSRMSTKVVIAR